MCKILQYYRETKIEIRDIDEYIKWAKSIIEEAKKRDPRDGIRIGYVGVPPIVPEIYGYIQDHGGQVVYNEVQHQFSMPYPDVG